MGRKEGDTIVGLYCMRDKFKNKISTKKFKTKDMQYRTGGMGGGWPRQQSHCQGNTKPERGRPAPMSRASVLACTCDPRTGKAETGGFLSSLASQSSWISEPQVQ